MSRKREKRRITKGTGLPRGAVAADCSRQVPNNSYGFPPTYYTDVEFTCRDCGKRDVWSAKEQKWYYEVVKGSLYQEASRCRECRKRVRAEKKLQRQQMEAAVEKKRKA